MPMDHDLTEVINCSFDPDARWTLIYRKNNQALSISNEWCDGVVSEICCNY